MSLSSGLHMARRIRRTPYTDRVEAAGVRGFTVTNHMLLPKAFQPTVEEDYWHLKEHVQLWDVACERQVEIKGPDAARLVQWMTSRNITKCRVGQCFYVPLVDEKGGLINDPVLLKHAEDHFWLSIADSDVLLWAKGLALGAGMNVSVEEPDVSPLAVQGPKAEDLLASLFGEHVRDIAFFRFGFIEFNGTQQLIARSGYSKQGGFEIYLNDSQLGPALWDRVMEAGQPYNITPGCPNLIERIEGGLLSYGNEFTRGNHPLECGLAMFCDLSGDTDYLGLKALQAIEKAGVNRQMRGLLFNGGPCPVVSKPWPVMADGKEVGQITSAIYSPRFKENVGLSLIESSDWDPGSAVSVHSSDGKVRSGSVRTLPFED